MKLRRFTKLALAGTALAATAATLTTATYAWYVANAEVSVTGVTGTVSATQASENLVVSNNTHYSETSEQHPLSDEFGAFGNTIAIADINNAQLAPITYFTETVNDTTVTVTDPLGAAGTAWNPAWKDDKGAAVANPAVLTYRFWLWGVAANNAATVSVTPSLAMINKTANLNTYQQTAYKPTAGVNENQKFIVDAVDALHMTITKREYTDAVGETPASLGSEVIVQKNIDLGNFKDTADEAYVGQSGAATEFATSGIEAGTYYYNVTGTRAYGTGSTTSNGTSDKVSAATSLSNISLTSNKKTLVTFYVWLEGTDASCYDSCKNQTFDFVWDFSVTSA